MALRVLTLAALGLGAWALPLTLQDLEVADDTHSVGSYVREVRAAPPQNYHRSYENEGDGEIGYSRNKNGGGKKGYQHFDSYHKKAGDNYEFAKEDSFGEDDAGKGDSYGNDEDDEGAYSHRHERKEKYRKPRSESDDIREDFERVSRGDREKEEIREEANDGNGGVEAAGHNKADYVLPEKYTYGTGEEYNF